MTKYLLYLLLFLYVVTVPLPNNSLVDSGTRLMIYDLRPYFVLAFIGITFLYSLLNNQERLVGVLSNPYLSTLLLLGAIFPAYYVVLSFARDLPRVPVMGLYITWAVFSFLTVPTLLQRTHEFHLLLRLFVVASAIDWIWSFVMSLVTEYQPTHFENRLSFGYANPNHYAQILQVVLACALLGWSMSGTVRKLREAFQYWGYVGLIAGCLLLIVLARSRNALVFAVMFMVSYWFIVRGDRYVVALFALCAVALVFLFLATQFYGIEFVDDLSSGRITFWKHVTKDIVYSEDPVGAVMFGVERLPSTDLITPYDDLKYEKAFVKQRVDNTYLDIMVESGLVGLALFLLPYLYLFRVGLKALRDPAMDRRYIAWCLALMIGVAFQGMFATTIPTFGNSIGIFHAFGIMMPWMFRGAPAPATQAMVLRPQAVEGMYRRG